MKKIPELLIKVMKSLSHNVFQEHKRFRNV